MQHRSVTGKVLAGPFLLPQAVAHEVRLGRIFSFVEQSIHGDVQSAGQFFEDFDARHGAAILHARNIAAQQSGGFFQIALAQFFLGS